MLSAIKNENLICDLCGKTVSVGYNRPKSLHKTRKEIRPNLQKWAGLLICTRCRRTLRKVAKGAAVVKAD